MRIEWKWSIFNPVLPSLLESGVQIENFVFLGKKKLFRGNKYSLFANLLRANYIQNNSEIEFLSLAEEIRFSLFFVEIDSKDQKGLLLKFTITKTFRGDACFPFVLEPFKKNEVCPFSWIEYYFTVCQLLTIE